MRRHVTTVGFDADDTLWHNERIFEMTQARFVALLANYTEPETLMARLLDAERRNICHYGFGIKGFTLSMIETAVEVTDGRVPGAVVSEILSAGRDMLAHPVDLLPAAREAVVAARADYSVLLVTKGDLLDQERKLAQSGLGDLFHGVEIVSDKTPGIYAQIFSRHGDGATRGVMVGNSMKSDVLPMIAAGGWGVFVPQKMAWDLEDAPEPEDRTRFHTLPDLTELAACLDRLS